MEATINFNETRKFGVEIEFTGDYASVATYMQLQGVACTYEGYTHRTMNHWKIVTDSSCGYELVSPPMCGQAAFAELKVACDALNLSGCKVNKSCGLHVHHDANDLDVKSFANIFALYIKLEKTIDTFMPESRRADNNSFCNSLHTYWCNENYMLERLKKCKTIQQIASDVYGSRYHKVNAQSYLKHGTIEFRQHSGTLDFDKIYNWVLFTQRIVERAKEGSVQYTYKESTVPMLTLQKMLGIIGSSGASKQLQNVNTFYLKRAAQLSKAADTNLTAAC